MLKENFSLGKRAEEEAVRFLKRSGYRILARNYRTLLGEVDIIASDRGVLSFIEVKSRSSDRFGSPQEAVSAFKQRQISKAALLYLKEKDLLDKKARFDVVSVLCNQIKPKIELIKDAFELSPGFTP